MAKKKESDELDFTNSLNLYFNEKEQVSKQIKKKNFKNAKTSLSKCYGILEGIYHALDSLENERKSLIRKIFGLGTRELNSCNNALVQINSLLVVLGEDHIDEIKLMKLLTALNEKEQALFIILKYNKAV